jgi:transcriptional regulator with XRE-family HTH domain
LIKIEQLRAARALLNWSQTELAHRAGLSLPTVKRVEAGRGPKVSAEARQKLRSTLEAAGVEFTNGNAPGVRLKPRRRG